MPRMISDPVPKNKALNSHQLAALLTPSEIVAGSVLLNAFVPTAVTFGVSLDAPAG